MSMNEAQIRNILAAIDRDAEPERVHYLEGLLVKHGLPVDDPADLVNEERKEGEKTVLRWFKEALGGFAPINLYLRANAEAWLRLKRDVYIGDVNTGMVMFEGGLYRRTSGLGDCEETLYYIGHVGKNPAVRLEE